jgi:uncharacterized protein YdbL (DUF1318 family)
MMEDHRNIMMTSAYGVLAAQRPGAKAEFLQVSLQKAMSQKNSGRMTQKISGSWTVE